MKDSERNNFHKISLLTPLPITLLLQMIFFCALSSLLLSWPLVEDGLARSILSQSTYAAEKERDGRVMRAASGVVVADCRLAVTFIYLV